MGLLGIPSVVELGLNDRIAVRPFRIYRAVLSHLTILVGPEARADINLAISERRLNRA